MGGARSRALETEGLYLPAQLVQLQPRACPPLGSLGVALRCSRSPGLCPFTSTSDVFGASPPSLRPAELPLCPSVPSSPLSCSPCFVDSAWNQPPRWRLRADGSVLQLLLPGPVHRHGLYLDGDVLPEGECCPSGPACPSPAGWGRLRLQSALLIPQSLWCKRLGLRQPQSCSAGWGLPSFGLGPSRLWALGQGRWRRALPWSPWGHRPHCGASDQLSVEDPDVPV